MTENQFGKLLAFLERLDQAKIAYSMEHSRDNALMVTTVSPGVYWEIEFLDDGEIEVERYVSNGKIDNESVLEDLFAQFADVEVSPEQEVISHDAIART